MNQFIHPFSAVPRTALKCVWMRTGNPAQPLACHWEESGQGQPARAFSLAARPQNQRICA